MSALRDFLVRLNRGGPEFIFGRSAVDEVFARCLPDRWGIIREFRKRFGHNPNLKDPQTYNEKIAWRKLYEKDPRFAVFADKSRVKKIMTEKYGEGFVIPSLADVASPDDIPFESLRPPYIIKPSHGSQMNTVITEQNLAEMAADNFMGVKQILRERLAFDYSIVDHTSSYAAIQPRLIVEPLLGGEQGLIDYRIYTFGSEVFCFHVNTYDKKDKNIIYTNFYTPDWQLMPLRYVGRANYPDGYSDNKPADLDAMVKRASELGKDFSHVRVDLYDVGGVMKFGEMTFFSFGGHARLDPPEWDLEMGRKWILPGISPKEPKAKNSLSKNRGCATQPDIL